MSADAPEKVDPIHSVVFAVTDNGSGMDAATLARVCEQFFTTKGIGQGSGLGLSMVQGFARQSGGELRLQSRLASGTRAEVWLPQATPSSAEAGAMLDNKDLARGPRNRLQHSGRVLLVDDNAEVREMLAEMLEHIGFEVQQAQSGEKALAKLRSGVPCDALVTDYAMPGMTGIELFRQAQRLSPGLPGLVITGYADAGQTEDMPLGVAVAHKPLQMDELAERIVALIAAAQATAELDQENSKPPAWTAMFI